MSYNFFKKMLSIKGYRLEPIHVKLDQTDFNRLKKVYKNYQFIKLHFGCGPRILKGWVNIDLKYQRQKENDEYLHKDKSLGVAGNFNDFYAINVVSSGLPLPDDCVDVVFHEDFIEHLNQRDQIIFLAETLRVLKPCGIHRINTPDLLNSMSCNSDFNHGKKGVYAAEWNNHIHLNILTKNSLKELAEMVGYKQVIFNGKNKSISSLIPAEYRPRGDRLDDGNIFADLIK